MSNNSVLYLNRYFWCLVALVAVYISNGFVDIMDVDAAQYASIALEMHDSGSYLQVFHRGADYLDKPPLLFWLSALSFKFFGIGNFQYKLPAILLLVFSLYATWRFARIWYDGRRAIFSALILGSSTAYFLITNDIRTDGILTSFVIFSIWQLSEYITKGQLKYLLLGAAGTALAMMSKGPIGIVLVAFALGGHFILRREWTRIFDWKWLLFILSVLILLVPMCYGLYLQFDLHPEKVVYGLQGPSGIRFFFWTQSFGRITGDIYWANDTGYFYFLHTILWDFQPWIFLFIPAFVIKIWRIVRSGMRVQGHDEGMSISIFTLGFVALSMSNYKLPHYIFPLFPFAAVMTADFAVSLYEKFPTRFRMMTRLHFGLLVLFFVVTVVAYVMFFNAPWYLWVFSVLTLLLAWVLHFRISVGIDKLMLPAIVTMFMFGIIMSVYFYPNILNYQASSAAGKYIQQSDLSSRPIYQFNHIDFAFDFYSRKVAPELREDSLSSIATGSLIYTDPEGVDILNGTGEQQFRIVREFDAFQVTQLSLDFLNKDTRHHELRKRYLVEKTR